MNTRMRLALALGAAMSLAACATITRGTTSQVQIQSEPTGADVRTSTGFTCTTPCTMTVNRKDEFSVTFTKAGYEPEEVEVKTRPPGSWATPSWAA
ncbi:PEGA domain-containing protein [Xanthobacter flavus]|uniref:PEGA domain-containing protein n=1 Tax=Xanthobacter flavus TaxID=281 RepID=UPI00372971A3